MEELNYSRNRAIALMYDGLELGRFIEQEDGSVKLVLHKNIQRSWLPYLFDIGLDRDMRKIVPAWIKERVVPKNRLGIKGILKELGLNKYDRGKIARITRCSSITDPYWIAFDEDDNFYDSTIRGKIGGVAYPYNSIGIRNEGDYFWRK